MGSLVGHVLPGLAFIFLGLWHLFNQIKLHALNPNSYTSLSWFPTSKVRYLELLFIIAASSAYIALELFLVHHRRHPFDPDGSIPSNHLRNFEHSFISLAFLMYAVFALLLDLNPTRKPQRSKSSANSTNPLKHCALTRNPTYKLEYSKNRDNSNDLFQHQHRGLTQLLAAIAFAQQLLLFRLHSTDHTTVEGQYHALLQVIVLVSLAATLMGIFVPTSFVVGFVRSMSILFQGVWLVVLACMLWTPGLVPKGCFLHSEDEHRVLRCSGEAELRRAKALVNIEFSWFLMALTIFGVSFYIIFVRIYGGKSEYDKSLMEIHEIDGLLEVEAQEERELVVRGTYICDH